MERVYIASDQAGFFLKEMIKKRLAKKIIFEDLGVHNPDPVFFPLIGVKIGKQVSAENGKRKGIIFCDKCFEMNAIINKFPKAKSALVLGDRVARIAREKNNANVACVGIHTVNEMLAERIIDVFVNTEFRGRK